MLACANNCYSFSYYTFSGYNLLDTHPTIALLLLAVGIVFTIITSAIYSALTGISKAAMYNFATGNNLPAGFDKQAFVQNSIAN